MQVVEMVMHAACEPCRQRKRKCDRKVPNCGLCERRARQCYYTPHRLVRDHNPNQAEVVANQVYHVWAIQTPNIAPTPDVPVPYPITVRWYMPRLLKTFCEGLGVSRLPVAVNSTGDYMRIFWIQRAMSDPCLFHATLFAGSSLVDLQGGQPPSAMTLYHQIEAIACLNERLSDPGSATDDRTVMAITGLALYANLNGDQAAANIHREGLRKLVELRGRDKLGDHGLVGVLIQMNMLLYHMCFDSDPQLTPAAGLGPPPVALERRILDSSQQTPDISGLSSILDMFRLVYNFKLGWQEKSAHNNLPAYTSSVLITGLDDPIVYCCYLSMIIFRSIVNPQSHQTLPTTQLDAIASKLEASLRLTDPVLWIRRIPAIFSWVCLTGAAAASNSNRRIWFYLRQSPVFRVLNVRKGPAILDEIWAHFHWLWTARLSSSMYAVEDSGLDMRVPPLYTDKSSSFTAF